MPVLSFKGRLAGHISLAWEMYAQYACACCDSDGSCLQYPHSGQCRTVQNQTDSDGSCLQYPHSGQYRTVQNLQQQQLQDSRREEAQKQYEEMLLSREREREREKERERERERLLQEQEEQQQQQQQQQWEMDQKRSKEQTEKRRGKENEERERGEREQQQQYRQAQIEVRYQTILTSDRTIICRATRPCRVLLLV